MNVLESLVVFDRRWTRGVVVCHEPAVVSGWSTINGAGVESNRLVEPSRYLASGKQICNHIG